MGWVMLMLEAEIRRVELGNMVPSGRQNRAINIYIIISCKL